ncbi:hypothetical protein BC628DRAFT_44093 [Trametes gibbosa]|nr:hypothetical protein BC628DRAFT_44093 [Trametes gibbosa]
MTMSRDRALYPRTLLRAPFSSPRASDWRCVSTYPLSALEVLRRPPVGLSPYALGYTCSANSRRSWPHSSARARQRRLCRDGPLPPVPRCWSWVSVRGVRRTWDLGRPGSPTAFHPGHPYMGIHCPKRATRRSPEAGTGATPPRPFRARQHGPGSL